MSRFFLHLRDHGQNILDSEGVELPVEGVPGAALKAARDCMASDVKKGVVDLRCRIDVHDESNRLVHRLEFADAVEIIPPR